MNILIVEPFFGGSHEAWAKGLQKYSSNNIEILSLSAHNWKWRMHGGAVSLAEKFLKSNFKPDIILASDMLDLALFKSLTAKISTQIKTILYFHENQITYPLGENSKSIEKDMHYGFINFSSALVADKIIFNSCFHKNEFLCSLPKFLNAFPEPSLTKHIEEISNKSDYIYPGIEILSKQDNKNIKKDNSKPVFLWNHRWEQDKNPEEFFNLLYKVKNLGFDFSLILLGQRFSQSPACFAEAEEKLKENIIHSGYCKSKAEYFDLLNQADILPVTSFHDFFGYSVAEAILCNCYPLLPNRQAYPEHIPSEYQQFHIYKNSKDLLEKTIYCIQNINQVRKTKTHNFARRFLWQEIVKKYDAFFEKIE
jgi:glycosyltransferase involved in cell wall biosynthesis